MPLPPLSTTSASEWSYIAEGGANLVCSFNGAADSPYTGHALRLRKRKGQRVETSKEDEVPSEVNGEFASKVIEPLLGKERLPETEVVVVERDWLEALGKKLEEDGVRPPERVEEDEVDVDAHEVVVVEDLIGGGGVLAVEIKPKWGFLPSPVALSRSTRDLKTTYCRFCMHRFSKRFPSASSPPSSDDLSAFLAEHNEGFCPLDLHRRTFSRCVESLERLCETWSQSEGEGNNLRFFLDGKKLLPTEPADFDRLYITLRPLKSTTFLADQSPPRSLPFTFSHAIVDNLCTSPTLVTLRHLQHTLDCLDIEGLAALLREDDRAGVDLSSAEPDLARLGQQPTTGEWASFVERYDHLLNPPTPGNSFTQREDLAAELVTANPRDAVLAYLLSATFKDCSLILRIPLPSSSSASSSSSSSFSPSVPAEPTLKVIDLDPKPLSRLGKYWRMDQSIVRRWGEMLDGLSEDERAKVRVCGDGEMKVWRGGDVDDTE
ncbi:hypothetical protein JCM8097_005513 [Rhodosporidiobolus ruineniae]